MDPRLVRCLLAAIVVGLGAAGWTLSAGWHPVLALLVYSLSGSFALVALTLATAARRAPVPRAPLSACTRFPRLRARSG